MFKQAARIYTYFASYKITEAGRFLISTAFLSAMLSFAVPGLYVFLTGFFVVFSLAIINIIYRPNIHIQGNLPEKTIARNPLTVSFKITNKSKRTFYDIGLGYFFLPKMIDESTQNYSVPAAKPGETLYVNLELYCRKRGLYTIPELLCFSSFPFNLYRCGKKMCRKTSLLVLPDFHPIDALTVTANKQYQAGGVSLASKVGESPEYIGNRQYQPGDSPRKIDPKAWARLAIPAVKEYNDEYYSNIAIIMDTYIPKGQKPGRDGFENLEAAISLTASIADSLSHGESIISIFAAGPDLYPFRSGRHTSNFDQLLEILACVEPCNQNPYETISPVFTEEMNKISFSIFVFLDWDSSREQLLRLALEAECATYVIIINDNETTESWQHMSGKVNRIVQLSSQTIQSGHLERL